jgi:hypothetical protein
MAVGGAPSRAALRREPDLRSADPPDPEEAARLLEGWGFLANADLPDGPGPGLLLVALRAAPALDHYDPERIEYWVSTGGRGSRASLTSRTATPRDADFSWGRIRIVDRLGVANEWLTFGGRLTAQAVGDATIAVFASPVPLLRRGGHSQGWDPGAEAIGAFFGRLMVAVDFAQGFEEQLAEAAPIERYAAFVHDLSARFRRAVDLREADGTLGSLMRLEAKRLAECEPTAWAAGRRLADAAGLLSSQAAA